MDAVYSDPNGSYSLVIPSGWEHARSAHSNAVYNPDGVGALNISSYNISNEQALGAADLARDFLPDAIDKRNVAIRFMNCQDQHTRIAFAEYIHAGDAWRVWVLVKQGWAVVASYNCKQAQLGQENAVVDGIIKSLRVGPRSMPA